MGAFAVAQIFYISAFGLRPLKLWILLVFYAIGAGMIVLIFENLPDIIKVGLPIYAVLLLAMAWRAIARIDGVRAANNLSVSQNWNSFLFLIIFRNTQA
jgi:uncharacterized membrane protein YhhN